MPPFNSSISLVQLKLNSISSYFIDISYCECYTYFTNDYIKIGDYMINITSVRHAYPEPNGLQINRPFGLKEYTFLHFFQSVEIVIKGQIIKTRPHAVIIYNKSTPQFFKIHQPLIHNWMHFTGDTEELLKSCNLKFDEIYYPVNPSFATELVYEMEVERYCNRENCKELIALKFSELLIKLSRSVNGEISANFSINVKQDFQSLRRKMFSNLSKRQSVQDMAKEVGLSQSHFFKIYKQIYGVSPTDDLINARIEKAKQLLFLEKKRVNEVAEMLGYENLTHFIRQFKSKTDLSPTEYKKFKEQNN